MVTYGYSKILEVKTYIKVPKNRAGMLRIQGAWRFVWCIRTPRHHLLLQGKIHGV